jgi:hypothetical protein
MSTALEVALGAVVGAMAGAVSGAICGGIGAFSEGYMSPLARLVNHEGRTAIARANVPAGRRLGGIVGLLIGGIAGGFGSLTIGLVTAAAVGVAALVTLRRISGEPIVGAAWAIIGGAFSGALIGYVGRLDVNAL